MVPCSLSCSVLPVLLLWLSAAAAVGWEGVLEYAGPARPLPALGYGNELLFQAANDSGLNQLVLEDRGQLQRFPGGTPSGFWDWQAGWANMTHQPCPFQPTSVAQWASYLTNTSQATIIVPNIVTSSLEYELDGLRAHVAAGTSIGYVELGNEIYDHTVAAVAQRYPNATVYGNAIYPWMQAIRREFPEARMAVCGQTPAWNAALMDTAGGHAASAITLHVYTGLPEGRYASDADAQTVLNRALLQGRAVAATVRDSVPSNVAVWFTETGTFGATLVEQTWLQALTVVRQSLYLLSLNQTQVLLPYCLVCGDPSQPSFTTPVGPYPPPPNGTYSPGPWFRTPSGIAHSALLRAAGADGVAQMRRLELLGSSNPLACAYQGVGAAGPALKWARPSTPLSCQALCSATAGCAFWQHVNSTSSCYLKNSSAVLGGNSADSVAGPTPSQCHSDEAVAGFWFGAHDGTFAGAFLLNSSPEPYTVGLSALGLGSSTLRLNQTFAPGFQGLTRQHVNAPPVLNTTTAALAAPLQLQLRAYSIATLTPA